MCLQSPFLKTKRDFMNRDIVEFLIEFGARIVASTFIVCGLWLLMLLFWSL